MAEAYGANEKRIRKIWRVLKASTVSLAINALAWTAVALWS
jgi:hypothetical protein